MSTQNNVDKYQRKLYCYIIIVIKRVWHYWRNRFIGQRTRIENLEINAQKFASFFLKAVKIKVRKLTFARHNIDSQIYIFMIPLVDFS
jgi:hypothetical protein